MRNFVIALTTAATLALSISPGGQPIANALTHNTMETNSNQADGLVGVWEFTKGDIGATYVIVLDLKADGSYTKQLRTSIGAGGTHSGTWKYRGAVVYLSGDGNWPPISHDLSTFTKVS